MSNSNTLPFEHIIQTPRTGIKRWGLAGDTDGNLALSLYDETGDLQATVLTIDEDTGVVAIVGDVTVTGGVAASGGTTGVVNYRTVAEDVVPTIGLGDAGGTIELLLSTTGAKAILTDTSDPGAVDLGQEVTIFLTARGGGSYTLALSTGTLTFDAALECAKIVRTSLGWNVVSLNGATIV